MSAWTSSNWKVFIFTLWNLCLLITLLWCTTYTQTPKTHLHESVQSIRNKCLCIFGPLVETSSENLHFTLEIGFSEHVCRYLAKIYPNRGKPSYRRFLEKGLFIIFNNLQRSCWVHSTRICYPETSLILSC